MRPDNREVKHVSAYSHSDRWVSACGAWRDAWIGVGEIRWSQGICKIFVIEPFLEMTGRLLEPLARYVELRMEQAKSAFGSRGKCSQGGWCFLRDDSSGEQATPSSHHRSSRGQRLRSHCYVIARAQRTFRAPNRECDKQGAGARENSRPGLSVNVQTA
jgi:hypothetical protein